MLQKTYSGKFFKTSAGSTIEESLFLIMLQTLYLKLHKNAILTSMNSYAFWDNFSRESIVRLPLDEVYLFHKNVSPKNVQNFLPKLCEKCSLYAENYFVNRNSSQPWIFQKILRYWLFCLIKNKENFSNRENCFIVVQLEILHSCPN